ncbi:MAG: DNA-3-methyladenine glycosylase 2 family protein [Acidimicrobiales bacterium]|nr:DNA-3-methyladenine glycosylase 2 family protein [Acidimicrobiales bacterium]
MDDARGDETLWWDGGHRVLLPFRAPLALDELIEFLGARAVPGVEAVVDGAYHRVLRLPGGPGVVSLRPDGLSDAGRGDGTGANRPPIVCHLRLTAARDAPAAVAACRRVLDLDADPAAVDTALAADPHLAPLVATTPGRRAPVHPEADELALRAVLGQQVSLAAARRLAGQLTQLCGEPLANPVGPLTTAFPTAAAVAEADLDRLGMPGSRRATLRGLAAALAGGAISLSPDADPDEVERRLLDLRGIGPWTASYIRMRGLGDPDVVLTTDLGVRHALDRLGMSRVDPRRLRRRWSPVGSYAVHHLWASLPSPEPSRNRGDRRDRRDRRDR